MSVPPLLAIALGALKGGVEVREKKKADALAARRQEREDLQDELALRAMPGVTLEDTADVRKVADPKVLGPLIAAASGGMASGLGLPGSPAPAGQDAGEVTLGNRRLGVRFDPTQTKDALAKAERTKSAVQWQTVTNPRTKLPFTQEEAELLATGKAKYSDFKPEPAAPHVDPLSPEGITASGKRAGAEAAARAPYAAPPAQIVTDDAGNLVVVNKRDASTHGTGLKAPPKPAGGARGTASIQKAIASNRRQLSAIDDAIAKVTAHTSAVGILRGRVDAVDQRIDPRGVEARAAVADVGSLQLHDRSGAAVTASEWPRLAPFIPKASDTPQTVIKKLRRMRKLIEQETSVLQSGGASPPTTASKGAAPDAVIDDALAKNGNDWAKAHAYLVSQGYE